MDNGPPSPHPLTHTHTHTHEHMPRPRAPQGACGRPAPCLRVRRSTSGLSGLVQAARQQRGRAPAQTQPAPAACGLTCAPTDADPASRHLVGQVLAPRTAESPRPRAARAASAVGRGRRRPRQRFALGLARSRHLSATLWVMTHAVALLGRPSSCCSPALFPCVVAQALCQVHPYLARRPVDSNGEPRARVPTTASGFLSCALLVLVALFRTVLH